MRQQFQRTFDQVRMTPEQMERVRQALTEGQSGVELHSQRKRRKLLALAALAGAAVLLMGAAAVWQSGLSQYFQRPGGSVPADLSQYAQPVHVSGASEDGWTLTVEECIGDDQWVFLWLTLAAPEGSELPVLGADEYFHLPIRLSKVSEEIREHGGYSTRIQVYDQVPGDNQVQAVFGMQTGVDPEGQQVSITVDQLSYYRDGTEGIQLLKEWNKGITVENVILEYPNTVVHTPLNLSVPFCNTNSKATDLKVTPFYFSIDFQLEAPLAQILKQEISRLTGKYPASNTALYHTTEAEIFMHFEDATVVELHLRDGTTLQPAAARFRTDEDAPYWFQVEWEYRYIYNSEGELVGEIDGNQTFSVNPTQIESFAINGIEIPFIYAPEK